jgi:hypothetical protein
MFGMLDYRAYKLKQLIWLPFRVAAKLSMFIAIAMSILIAQITSFNPLIKIVLAYVLFELIAMIFLVMWGILDAGLGRFFFWLIDVVPAHGQNAEEAKAIALKGRIAELDKKLWSDIANWTLEDTEEYVAHMNWRARLFFGMKLKFRMNSTVRELQRIYNDNGQLPSDIGINGLNGIREKLPGGKVPILERLIVNQAYFNSLVATVLIVVVIGYAKAGML